MSKKYQISSDVLSWSTKTADGEIVTAKKISFEAEDYNVNLICSEGGKTDDSKNKFTEMVKISLNQSTLRNFVKGLLGGFLTKLRSNTFRKNDGTPMQDEVFFDGRLTVKNQDNIYLIRLIGGYKIINNRRVRQTNLRIYGLSSWGEITQIRETKKYDESKCLFKANLKTNSVADDCFSPEDRILVETIFDQLYSLIIGTNVSYGLFLQSLHEENNASAPKKSSESTGTVEETTTDYSYDNFEF